MICQIDTKPSILSYMLSNRKVPEWHKEINGVFSKLSFNKSVNTFFCFQLLPFLLNRTFSHKEPNKCKYVSHDDVGPRQVNGIALRLFQDRVARLN